MHIELPKSSILILTWYCHCTVQSSGVEGGESIEGESGESGESVEGGGSVEGGESAQFATNVLRLCKVPPGLIISSLRLSFLYTHHSTGSP